MLSKMLVDVAVSGEQAEGRAMSGLSQNTFQQNKQKADLSRAVFAILQSMFQSWTRKPTLK
jgi:hypothetical protein